VEGEEDRKLKKNYDRKRGKKRKTREREKDEGKREGASPK